ncbi:hypothetical protein ZIOFF_024729 [Zingiber officinale]|uniref:Uncharacterized protein n=1 Tax=Zingiber officinale TaxID=94328 RepID=A0A8J5H0P7_ZINOF|nr:hypothetical protein ZIOFF_024729 [Zingiber officinale]
MDLKLLALVRLGVMMSSINSCESGPFSSLAVSASFCSNRAPFFASSSFGFFVFLRIVLFHAGRSNDVADAFLSSLPPSTIVPCNQPKLISRIAWPSGGDVADPLLSSVPPSTIGSCNQPKVSAGEIHWLVQLHAREIDGALRYTPSFKLDGLACLTEKLELDGLLDE